MKPATPVAPGLALPITSFGRHQPQYLELPAFRYPDGRVVSRWHLSWTERLQVLFCGSIWLTVRTFHHKLQPVKIDTTCPLFDDIPWDDLKQSDADPVELKPSAVAEYLDPPDSEKL